MHFVFSALLLCAFVVLLLTGLASVLRDLLSRDFRPLRVARAAGDQHSRTPASLDLDLSCDLDHPLRRQVEPIDDLRRVPI
jgi:hypothetical protein